MFYYFFGIFYYGLGRNSSERYFYFLFSLFLGLSQLILAWWEAIMVFFKFLNFFAIFLEFSIPGLVGTHQNDFFFSSFSAFPNLCWLEKLPKWWFLIFRIFLLFFGIFYYELGRNSSERFFFLLFYFVSFSAFPNIFWLEKKPQWCFLIFWIFLRFFLNFLLRVG